MQYDNGTSLYIKCYLTEKGLLVEMVDQQKEFELTDKELVTLYSDEIDKIDIQVKNKVFLQVILMVIFLGIVFFIMFKRQQQNPKVDVEPLRWEKTFIFLVPVGITLMTNMVTRYYGFFHAGILIPCLFSLLFCLVMVTERRKPLRQRIIHFGWIASIFIVSILIIFGL
ncbi:hypothetical protein ACIQZG_14590 [Lysinibacillus sp. NPDC096418]|uniref:hypothetical protein n=1 Tax=Lysinibacillus sp. NPDC096418 TaxID=3364138 RepID=UPI00382DB5DF